MIKSNVQILIESVEIAENAAVEKWHVSLALELNRLRNDLRFAAVSFAEGVQRFERIRARAHEIDKPLFDKGGK